MAVPGNHTDIEKRLWDSADQLRANSGLKSSEYAMPVLGLIFLRFAEHRFNIAAKEIEAQASAERRRRTIGKADYQARGVLYLPEGARYSASVTKQSRESARVGDHWQSIQRSRNVTVDICSRKARA